MLPCNHHQSHRFRPLCRWRRQGSSGRPQRCEPARPGQRQLHGSAKRRFNWTLPHKAKIKRWRLHEPGPGCWRPAAISPVGVEARTRQASPAAICMTLSLLSHPLSSSYLPPPCPPPLIMALTGLCGNHGHTSLNLFSSAALYFSYFFFYRQAISVKQCQTASERKTANTEG